MPWLINGVNSMDWIRIVQLIILLRQVLDDGKLTKDEVLQIFDALGGK